MLHNCRTKCDLRSTSLAAIKLPVTADQYIFTKKKRLKPQLTAAAHARELSDMTPPYNFGPEFVTKIVEGLRPCKRLLLQVFFSV